MSQQFQFSTGSPWRGSHGERLWLSTPLVDAMEQTAEPARRAEPCDPLVLKGLRAQLALPAQPRFASSFSQRN